MGHGARRLRRRRRHLELLQHDQARQQILCFALALWNGTDPILKERLFGLTNSEGNHGEDVKEYYFYLDSNFDVFVEYAKAAGGAPRCSR